MPDGNLLTLSNLLNRAIIINVNIQPLGLEVHCLHRAGRKNAVFLGKICLCKGLREVSR
jgi:hypothetical protein